MGLIRLRMVEGLCVWCGVAVRFPSAVAAHEVVVFCSKACYGAWCDAGHWDDGDTQAIMVRG